MIARVAESCFWLHRHVERVDNTARLMGVHFAFLLDVPQQEIGRWRPLLVVAGAEDDFLARVGEAFVEDGASVQNYLVWDEENPVSTWNSLWWARENARTIRETLSLEAWTAINRAFLWMRSPEARALYEAEPPAFYERLRENCHFFHGVCNDTLPHDEPFEFMRLGMFLERAAQTARILDTKFHAVGPTSLETETTVELAEWIAILRSCSAYEPFFKRSDGSLTGPAVAEFLLLDPAFPRSVLHCLLRAWNFLQLIGGERPEGRGRRSAELLVNLLARLESTTMDLIIEAGLHDELTRIIDDLVVICGSIQDDYFSGRLPGSEVGAELGAGDDRRTLTTLPASLPFGAREQAEGDARILEVTHETVYTYDAPVRRSSHQFLLRPVDDERQDLLEYDLTLSVDGERSAFEDVFQNQALHFKPTYEFTELKIRSRARVRVRGSTESERIDFTRSLRHPIVWMPWQRMMMLPYLMPPELPETQLSELSRFAHDFVDQSEGDLVRALSAINQAIHTGFLYEPGSTTVETTPYETFIRRQGVCQDFAYLFIILAQLLNVPARYRVGYIYTGGDYEGQVRSDASHAWAEIYLPRIGWYGFDPANGTATGDVDYVRVSTGRHYRDAAPVTGTIFEGGGGERLQASVRVEMP
ncbi:MAG: alpha-E domain-containing protein [Gemmatimonadota bacterium]